MDFYYWENQLILYTKGHFGRIEYEKDLKNFAAKLYGLDLKYTDHYNVFGMVVRLYQKLIDHGLIRFTLEEFLNDTFKRSARERNKTNEINDMDIMRHMLASIQNVQVKDTVLNLGGPDREMKKTLAAVGQGREGELK